jgi:hypothetical protein
MNRVKNIIPLTSIFTAKRQNYFRFLTSQEKNKKYFKWAKYGIGVPLVAGAIFYQYTKYHFLKYTIPE